MAKFEFVQKYAAAGLPLPNRSTEGSAGYDFVVAEDIVVPSIAKHFNQLLAYADPTYVVTLDEISQFTRETGCKPTLVSTGVKCKLDKGEYLELSARSSTPLKYWLTLANGVGIIDSDYYNNPSNEGEIFLQLINLSPFDILLKKGEKIGQGIVKTYLITEDDAAAGQRTGGFGSTNG